jgi:hypothetical protein
MAWQVQVAGIVEPDTPEIGLSHVVYEIAYFDDANRNDTERIVRLPIPIGMNAADAAALARRVGEGVKAYVQTRQQFAPGTTIPLSAAAGARATKKSS